MMTLEKMGVIKTHLTSAVIAVQAHPLLQTSQLTPCACLQEQKQKQREREYEKKREQKARDRQLYYMRHTRDYETLELPVGASRADVKAAYRKLAKVRSWMIATSWSYIATAEQSTPNSFTRLSHVYIQVIAIESLCEKIHAGHPPCLQWGVAFRDQSGMLVCCES